MNVPTLDARSEHEIMGSMDGIFPLRVDSADEVADTRPACRVVAPMTAPAPIVFASPHSGAYYPDDMQRRLRVPLMDLRRTEDALVDELFADAPRYGAPLIAAQYGRAFVDLNRDARELDPSMFHDGAPRSAAPASTRVDAGLGCLPKIAARGEPIYADRLTRAEGEWRLSHVHDAYHQVLRQHLDRGRREHRKVYLIDCHSMPSNQPGRRPLADVVLGDRFGSSCDNRLTEMAERLFRSLGYKVVRNAPYAGGYTTRRYGRPKRGFHALQIEINRALYMDEARVERSQAFQRLRIEIAGVSRRLIDFARAQT